MKIKSNYRLLEEINSLNTKCNNKQTTINNAQSQISKLKTKYFNNILKNAELKVTRRTYHSKYGCMEFTTKNPIPISVYRHRLGQTIWLIADSEQITISKREVEQITIDAYFKELIQVGAIINFEEVKAELELIRNRAYGDFEGANNVLQLATSDLEKASKHLNNIDETKNNLIAKGLIK